MVALPDVDLDVDNDVDADFDLPAVRERGENEGEERVMEMKMDKTVHLSRKKKITAKQAHFLKTLQQNNFNISATCQDVSIARSTFYLWRENPEFLSKCEELEEVRIDLYEQALHEVVLAGDTRAIIFALKTIGKNRGYVERENGDTQSRNMLMKVLSGEVTVREAAYQFAMLGRPLPEVLKLELQQKEPEQPPVVDPITPEEMDRKYNEAMAERNRQKDEFLSERRAEIVELKEALKGKDSFKPEG